jgi:hypothetical protein
MANIDTNRERRIQRAARSYCSWTNQVRLLTTQCREGWSDDGNLQLDLFRHRVVDYQTVVENFTGVRGDSWYRNGLLHREEGPAELDHRYRIARFALNGYWITFEHFCRVLELTDEEVEHIRAGCGEYRPV